VDPLASAVADGVGTAWRPRRAGVGVGGRPASASAIRLVGAASRGRRGGRAGRRDRRRGQVLRVGIAGEEVGELSFVSVVLPAVPPGRRSTLEPAAGAAAAEPSTKSFVASPQPRASTGAPPTTRRTIAPPVAAKPPLYVASAIEAKTPLPLAMTRWRPGSSRSGAVQAALRVTVPPEAVT
jgi:hypothetical protein